MPPTNEQPYRQIIRQQEQIVQRQQGRIAELEDLVVHLRSQVASLSAQEGTGRCQRQSFAMRPSRDRQLWVKVHPTLTHAGRGLSSPFSGPSPERWPLAHRRSLAGFDKPPFLGRKAFGTRAANGVACALRDQPLLGVSGPSRLWCPRARHGEPTQRTPSRGNPRGRCEHVSCCACPHAPPPGQAWREMERSFHPPPSATPRPAWPRRTVVRRVLPGTGPSRIMARALARRVLEKPGNMARRQSR